MPATPSTDQRPPTGPRLRLESQPTPTGSAAGPCTFDSRALLAGRREVLISHGGEVYRLRHTRNDKLILTK